MGLNIFLFCFTFLVNIGTPQVLTSLYQSKDNVFLLVQLNSLKRTTLETQVPMFYFDFQVTGRNVRAKDGELAASQAKVDALSEEAARLKMQLDTVQASNMIKLFRMNLFFARSPGLFSLLNQYLEDVSRGYFFLNINTLGLSFRYHIRPCSLDKEVMYSLTMQIEHPKDSNDRKNGRK